MNKRGKKSEILSDTRMYIAEFLKHVMDLECNARVKDSFSGSCRRDAKLLVCRFVTKGEVEKMNN